MHALHALRILPAAAFLLLLSACSFLESGEELLNVTRVEFSEGDPAVDGQTIAYVGGVVPSLDKFRIRMVFHVKADNSRNSGKAVFGSDAVKPVLNFRIQSRSAAPIATPIPAFSIAGGQVADLEFPVEVPLSALDKAVAKKIADGDPIPYFLSGTLEFELLEGTRLEGKGSTELDLTSGEISTRPEGGAAALLSGLL